ncbi:MAG TPA: UDP-N-acetylmuramate dehydrogenase [Acidimicrobiales bacterium]
MTTPSALEALAERLRATVGPRLRRDEPLGAMTTYRVGGVARLFVDVDDEAVLARVAASVAAVPDSAVLPLLVVGKGSNLLVHDDGFPGLAIRLGDGFATMAIDGREIRAGGGVALPVLARQTAAVGLTGLEWAVGVPGSVGGGVRMNAGGHGSDMAATLTRVRRLDLRTGEDDVVAVADLRLGYRHSDVGPDQVVVRADFGLADGDAATATAEITEIVRWRRENQPGGPNAGSVFTNPDGDSAGRLIEASGAKGLRVGTAVVSTKHANFIQADPGGRAADIHALMVEVRERVRAASGVTLVPETRLVGFPPDEGDR